MLYIIEAGNNDDRMKIINSLNKSDFRQFGNFKNVYYQKIYYDNKKPIGFIVAERHNEKGKLVVDISLAVIPEYRGKGLAYKMAYEAIKKLKKDKNIYKIYWGCEKNNTASILLAKKLGFEHDYDNDKYTVYKMICNSDYKNESTIFSDIEII